MKWWCFFGERIIQETPTLIKVDILDDFGDPSGESYITYSQDLTGTYSNSNAKGNLFWNIKINPDTGKMFFILKENGEDRDVTTSSSSIYYVDSSINYTITFKLVNGTTQSVDGSLTKSATYHMNNIEPYIPSWWGMKSDWSCLDLFTTNSSLKVVIKSNYGSYSLGSMDLTGLEGMIYDDTLYNQGIDLMKLGKYQEAISTFQTYKKDNLLSYNRYGAEAKVEECKLELSKINYNDAKSLMNQGKYAEAIEKFRACRDYSDAKELLAKCSNIAGIYSVGDVGPAGGLIFYDCDADNDSGNADGLISLECGWRYLEVVAKDVVMMKGLSIIFGYYRTSDSGENLIVGTDTAIGTGKANTEALIKAMGETAYSRSYGGWRGEYAAMACADYSVTVDGVVYDDWFLPSLEELRLMYNNLFRQGLGSFSDGSVYWSSSEKEGKRAWNIAFYVYSTSSEQGSADREYPLRVRPVRAF